jgi:hypothetical protein
MLIQVDRDEDMPGVIAQLQIINQLRGWGPDGTRPITERFRGAPWCRTIIPNERYL